MKAKPIDEMLADVDFGNPLVQKLIVQAGQWALVCAEQGHQWAPYGPNRQGLECCGRCKQLRKKSGEDAKK